MHVLWEDAAEMATLGDASSSWRCEQGWRLGFQTFVMGIIGTYYPPLTSPFIFRLSMGGKKFCGVHTLFPTTSSFLTYFFLIQTEDIDFLPSHFFPFPSCPSNFPSTKHSVRDKGVWYYDGLNCCWYIIFYLISILYYHKIFI